MYKIIEYLNDIIEDKADGKHYAQGMDIPVSYVGVHPIRWKELTTEDPDVGFTEILEESNEIRLDEETTVRCGYDECEINDGVAPDTVLAAGVINKGYNITDEVEEISFVIISDSPLQK